MSFAQSYPYPYPGGVYPGYQQPQPMPDQLAMLRQQQYQPQQMPQVPQMMPQPDNGIIWVQGEAGARGYIVAPGNTVPLWDSEANTIYLKSVDPTGVPSMRIFDYTERTTSQRQPPVMPQQDYITRKEFEAVISQIMRTNTPTGFTNTPTMTADTPIGKEEYHAD